MYSTANLTDVELKDQGNRLFSARKFEDAIGCYSKAIVSSPVPIYYCSRLLPRKSAANFIITPNHRHRWPQKKKKERKKNYIGTTIITDYEWLCISLVDSF